MLNKAPILIVDDNEGTCKLIEKKLRGVGMASESVHSGAEAIAECRKDPKRFLALDYRLLDMTGEMVIETLAREDIFPHFVIITGGGDERIAVQMMKLGALDYIVKDTNFIEILPSIIQRALDRLNIDEELKESQEALRTSEKNLRVLMDQAADCIVITDRDGNLIDANQATLTLLGYSKEELLSLHIRDLLSEEEANRVPIPFEDLYSGKNVILEQQWKGKDGSFVTIEISAKQLDDGRIQGIARDLTRRNEAEAEHHKLMTAIDQMGETVLITDIDAMIQYVNPAFTRVTGYTKEEVLGKNPSILKSGKTDEKLYNELWETVTNGKTWQGRFINNRKDGTEYIEDASISPVADGSGQVTHYVCVKRDVTNQVNLEMQIQHTQRIESLGIVTGGIAHDFNNLLAGILGNVGLAQMKLGAESPAYGNIKDIELTAQRAADLTNQLLAYSGKGKFVIETFNFNDLIEEMGHLLKTVIDKNVGLRYALADNLPAIDGDMSQIRQIIMNLITNASDALEQKNGFVTVTTGAMHCDEKYISTTFLHDQLQKGDYVFIEVSDTGMGMDKETIGRIFDPFFSTKPTGRGLGLASLMGIVRGHNGSIKIYSEPGKGTSFKVFFPVSDKLVLATSSQNAHSGWQGSGTVLIVDDEEMVLQVMTSILEQMGFLTLTAADGREGIETYKSKADIIDLVVLDMTMPHMDGEQTFREMRIVNDGVKVLLTSGFTEQDITARFSGKGLAGFIQKPFKVEDFINKIKGIMGE